MKRISILFVPLLSLLLLTGCPDLLIGNNPDLNAEYTVIYSGNGSTNGSVPVDGSRYKAGDTVTVLENTGNLTKDGYPFAGWNTRSDGTGTMYSPGQTFTMNSWNVTLYAQWTPLTQVPQSWDGVYVSETIYGISTLVIHDGKIFQRYDTYDIQVFPITDSMAEYLTHHFNETECWAEMNGVTVFHYTRDPVTGNIEYETALGIETYIPYEDILLTLTDADVPDPNLREVFEYYTGKSFGEITNLDLTRIGVFIIDGSTFPVSDLTGIEWLTNVGTLSIESTNLTDISGLASLTELTVLSLDNTNLTDISALGNLTNLVALDLPSNNISDISILSNLVNLTHLNLSDNNITDISGLAGLTSLTDLDIAGNSISDITPLAGLINLILLDLENNNLDLSAGSANRTIIDNFLTANVILTFEAGNVTEEGDTIPPVITLNDANPMQVSLGETFTDPGAVVTDNVDAERTITGTGIVDTTTEGSYTLSYNAVDTAGNAAVEVNRTVNVTVPLEPPTISLASGTYTSSQTVTITHPNPEARIRYTLDNTRIYDESIGTLYTGSITVSSNTTLIARAFHDDINPSSEGYSWWFANDYAIVSPGETNMIANGDFSDGLVLWKFFPNEDAEASFSVVNGVFTVNITEGGVHDWNVHLNYDPRFLLEQNEYYQLDFTAWVAGERQIGVQLHEEGIDNNGDGSSYSEYFGRNIDLTTSPQEFSFLMSMSDIDDPQASLRFNLGIETADVYIDDISLKNVVPTITYLTETDVPDPNLRTAFEDVTGKTFGQITDMDLLSLPEGVMIADYGITNLTGLEYCDNIIFMLLDGNDLSGADVNLSVISEMDSLLAINLWGCNLQNLDFLSGMSQLTGLAINYNDTLSYSDIRSLNSTNFPDLWSLSFSAFDSTDDGEIDPVSESEWTEIVNLIGGHTNLERLNMDRFGCSSSMIIQLTNVLTMEPTRWEMLTFNQFNVFGNPGITDLSWITGMINLEYLELCNNNITDLAPLKLLYDSGAFHNHLSFTNKDIDIRYCNLDLQPGSANMAVIDYLIDQGVRIEYEDGNNLGTGTIDITIQ